MRIKKTVHGKICTNISTNITILADVNNSKIQKLKELSNLKNKTTLQTIAEML